MHTNNGGNGQGPATALPAQHRAASYARRSALLEEAVLAQHETNAARAQQDGFEIPAELRWGDDGTSGTTIHRQSLDELLGVIGTGNAPFSRLYIRDRDRLARTADPRFPFFVEFLCKMHHVQLCYATDAHHAEYSSDNGGDEGMVAFILAALKNVQSYQELVATKRRTLRGTRISLKQGRFVGARAPYGYERWLVSDQTGAFVRLMPDGKSSRASRHHVRLRANSAEQVVVQHIFDALLARRSYAEIARELEATGAPRPGVKPWSAGRVRDVARNPIHTGDYVHGWTRRFGVPILAAELNPEEPTDQPVLLQKFVKESAVTAAQWARVQEIMDRRAAEDRQRKRASPAYLLTGLLRCQRCGDALYGHRQVPRKGVRVRMYRHNPPRSAFRSNGSACPFVNRYIHADLLESAALEATRTVLASDAAERLARKELERMRQHTGTHRHETAVQEAENALAATMRAAAEANIRAARATDEIERRIHDETVLTLAAEAHTQTLRVQSLRAEVERIAVAEAKLPKLAERRTSLLELFAAGTPEGQKAVVAEVVEAMLVEFDTNSVAVRVRTA